MMRMSSQVEYGLRAMLDIALNGSDGPVQAGDIHRRQGIDEHFVSQILLMLRQLTDYGTMDVPTKINSVDLATLI